MFASMEAELERLVTTEVVQAERAVAHDYDRRDRESCDRIDELTGIIRALLAADERGQGTPFAEAMDAAAKAAGWKS